MTDDDDRRVYRAQCDQRTRFVPVAPTQAPYVVVHAPAPTTQTTQTTQTYAPAHTSTGGKSSYYPDA